MNRIQPPSHGLAPLLACLGLATLLLITSGRAAEPAAQLIGNTLDKTNPTATFSIRFSKPMVDAASVGKVADPAPVELQPPIKGKFTWLSTRSGTWAPEEPLPLSSTFRFAFRTGAKDLSGEALSGEIEPEFQTPGFIMKGSHSTKYLNRDDVTAQPDFNLLFNADIKAEDAASFLTFTNKDGKKVAAKVIQADPVHHPLHRFPRYRSSDQSLLTWSARFYDKTKPSLGARPAEVARNNQLYVTPVEPLSIGDDWKLVVAEGLPSTETGVNLLEAAEIPIGNVKPFGVREVMAINDGQGERRIAVHFTKPLAGTVKPENVQQWIKITPSPKKLTTTVEGPHVIFAGDFKLGTDFRVDVARGLAATEPFTLPEAYQETVSFEPIPPSLVLEGFATHQLNSGTRNFHMQAINVPKIRVTAKIFQPETAPLALKAYDEYLNPPNAKDDEWHRKINADKLPGKTIYSRIITGTTQVDTESEIKLAWNDILGVGKTGVVLITAEQVGKTQRPGVQAIVQVTDLGVVWKSSTNETFAHVFSLATGAPVAGVKVHLVSAENTSLAAVTTDATGMAILPSSKKAEWLRAENGADLHLVPLADDSNHLSLYRFHLPFRDDEDEDSASPAGKCSSSPNAASIGPAKPCI